MVRSTGVGIFHAPPPRAIIPDARALGAFENQDTCDGNCGLSKRAHEKIGDCEQSTIKRSPLLSARGHPF